MNEITVRYVRDGVSDLRIFKDLKDFRKWCEKTDELNIKISKLILTRGI